MKHLFSFRQRPNETLTHSTTRGLNGSRMVVETTVKDLSSLFRGLGGSTVHRALCIVNLLLALSFGFSSQAWAGYTWLGIYGDVTGGWNSSNRKQFTYWYGNSDGKFYMDFYMPANTNKYWRLYTNNDLGPSGSSKQIKVGDTAVKPGYNGQTYSYYYNGNAGIIRIAVDQTSDEWAPYMWIERPKVKFKHPWGTSSDWTEKEATDNNDGTYTLDAQYGGTKGFNAGSSDLKYNTSKTTLVGSPTTGDKCQFKWDANGYKLGSGEENDCGTFTITRYVKVSFYDGSTKIDDVETLYNTNITTLAAPTKTGYDFVTWNTKADGNGTDVSPNVLYGAIKSDMNLYAKWTPKNYTITYDPATAPTGCTYTTAPTSGVYNTNVAMEFTPDANYVIASVTAYKTGASSTAVTVTKTDDTHYSFTQPAYAVTVKVEVSLSSVQVTYGRSGNGTIVGKVGGTDIGTSPASVDGGATVVFTATPSANYTVEGWYANSSCTGDKLQDGDNTGAAKTYTISNITEDRTVYVKFRETTRTISVAKGTGISSVSPTSTNAYVTTKSADISATLKDGYRDLVWNLGSGITVAGGYTTSSNPIKVNATANGTITANATEILHDVTMASSDDNKGTVEITSDRKQAGIATAITITATPKAGYYFTGWTASDGSKVTFGDSKSETTTAKVTADGIIITANFANRYAFRGSLNETNNPHGGMPGWGNDALITFTEGTGTVQYTLQPNKQYKFLIYDLKNSKNRGFVSENQTFAWNGTATFDGTFHALLNTRGTGTYTFTIAMNGDNPRVTLVGQVSHQITFGKGTGGSTITAISSIDGTITTGQYVKSGANVTFSQTAGTGYHFVEWNTKNDKSGTQLGTDATLVLNNVTENKTVYSTYAKTDYNITYPSGTNYTIEKTKDIANYLDNVTFKATPKDGYRLEVTAKDASNNNVTLTHNDFSYDYSFSMPASNVTISVTEYPYKIGGNFVNGGGSADFDANKYDFDENHQHTFTLNAQTSYKFKIYNENYKGQNDHYMGMEGNWDIDHTTLNSEVTCAGAACFVIKTGIAGQYTIKVKTGANNKPVVDIIYPNVSKLVYNGTDYPFTDLGNGTWKAGPLSLAASTTFDDDIRMYWEGTCIKNDNNQTMSASNHTNWGMERYTSGTYYIKLTTAGSNNTFAKNPDNYYFYYKPNASPKPTLTVEYPSYWRGDAGTTLGWNYDHPMVFVNDVATIELNVQTAGERQMKVIVDGQYWTYTGDAINTSTNNIQFEKDAQEKLAAFKFNVAESMKGIYTFTFNRSNHQMSVNYPDVVQYDITYTDAEGTKTIKAGPNGGRGISAANKPGYKFVRWDLNPDDASKIAVADNDKTRQTTTVYGKAEGCSITAIYTNEHFIYFKNIPGWSDVWVQFYKTGSAIYFDASKGTGTGGENNESLVNGATYHMTHIDKTDIWYFDYSGFAGSISSSTVAFTDNNQSGHDFFDQCQVVYRGDFGECAPMMVPINYIDQYLNQHNNQRTCYYGQGHWMKYDAAENTAMGIKLHIYKCENSKWTDISGSPFNFLADNDGSYSSHVSNINLPQGNYIYHIKLEGCATGGTWYGNTGKMNPSSCTNWVMSINAQDMEFDARSAGPYTFRLTTGDGQLKLSAEYPLVEGDFRVIKTNNSQNYYTGLTYKHVNTQADTASFYYNSETESGYTFKVQKCTNAGQNKWADVSGAIFTNPTQTGIYNFIFSHEGENVTIQKTEPYTGKFYIRTEGVDGGMESYKGNADNEMTYYGSMLDAGATYSNFPYNYYKAKWIWSGKDVTFCIANDYSKYISGDFTTDAILNSAKLPQNTNVRFMWNSETNQLSRAYISGSTNIAARFLVMIGDDKMFDKDGKALTEAGGGKIPGLNDYELNFADNNNWVYQADIKAQPGCAVKLIATYNETIQYFIGGETETKTIISGGSGDTKYTMRAVYDFKTNRLIVGWIPPEENIDEDIILGGDMLLIRTHQGDVQQIVFNQPATEVSDIQHIYGVLTLKKDTMIGKTNANYAQTMYWISFPFDVKLSEVFGTGIYGTDWIVQRYRGDLRAQKGWFKQETPTFWEYMEPTDTLKAYEGYVFLVDANKFNTNGAEAWKNSATEANFYFPSASDKIGIIRQDSYEQTVPEHVCKIDREFEVADVGIVNHKITDSHWNVIGVPAFQNNKPTATPTYDKFKSYYAWNPSDNKYKAEVVTPWETEFKTMHAYMVQFAGEITWSNVSVVKQNAPSRELAAQYADAQSYLITLRINDGKDDDQTYIRLSEKADAEFVLNEDMMKMDNTGSPNIYSFAGNYNVAYNETEMENQTINLGVNVPKNGNYTFSMPDNFNGSATLVDVVEGKVTELNVSDYTVTLNKGTYNNRFQLVLTVNSPIVTNVDEINNGWNADGKTKKLLINNTIYLINGGHIYNASGMELTK